MRTWWHSRQPQYNARLNTGHPLFDDLAFVSLGTPQSHFIDLISGALALDTTTGEHPSFQTRENGYNAVAPAAGHVRWNVGATEMDRIAGPHSIFAEAFSTTPLGSRELGFLISSDEGGAGHGMSLVFDPLVISLTNGFKTYGGASFQSQSSDQALGPNAVFNPQRFMATMDGTSHLFYSKGVLDTTAANTFVPTANANRRTRLFARYDTATNDSYPCAYSLIVVSKRPWGQAEYQALYRNPWGLFAPARKYFVATGAASSDVVAAGSLSITGAAALSATGSLVAVGALSITGAADLDARGSLAAAGSVSITGAAALTAYGDLEAAGSLSITGAAALNAIGQLLGAGTLRITGAADLTEPNPSDMSAAGALSISGAASLNALGQLVAAGSIVISGSASLASNVTDVAEAVTGGGWIEYELHLLRRRKRKKELEDIEAEQEKIEDDAAREIARFLQIQERKDEERKDIERIKALVQRHKTIETDSERVQAALANAQEKASRANLERLQKEMERVLEEEDDLLALLFIALNE